MTTVHSLLEFVTSPATSSWLADSIIQPDMNFLLLKGLHALHGDILASWSLLCFPGLCLLNVSVPFLIQMFSLTHRGETLPLRPGLWVRGNSSSAKSWFAFIVREPCAWVANTTCELCVLPFWFADTFCNLVIKFYIIHSTDLKLPSTSK